MARTIKVDWKGEITSLAISKLSREKLYGSRSRVALDADGEECSKASLTEDGEVLVRRGMTGQGYLTPSGEYRGLSDLQAFDEEGREVSPVRGTLGIAQEVEEATPEEVLDLRLTTVYLLKAKKVGEALDAALSEGRAFRFPFNYRTDYHAETGYLVKNDHGYFAVIGIPAPPKWVEPEAAPPPVLVIEDDDDLDFDMF